METRPFLDKLYDNLKAYKAGKFKANRLGIGLLDLELSGLFKAIEADINTMVRKEPDGVASE